MANFFLSIIFFLSVLSCSFKGIRESDLPGTVYQVKRGDTLSVVSHKYRVPVSEIMEVNGVLSATHVPMGQYLFLPETSDVNSERSVSKPLSLSKKINAKQYRDDGKKFDLIWPVKDGVVFKVFDERPESLFEGIALGAPMGASVRAVAKGSVIYVAQNVNRFGKMVIIKHDKDFVTIYAHLDKILVSKGKTVKSGDVIGHLGVSGGVSSPRLYFQVRKNRLPVDPQRYLKNK